MGFKREVKRSTISVVRISMTKEPLLDVCASLAADESAAIHSFRGTVSVIGVSGGSHEPSSVLGVSVVGRALHSLMVVVALEKFIVWYSAGMVGCVKMVVVC